MVIPLQVTELRTGLSLTSTSPFLLTFALCLVPVLLLLTSAFLRPRQLGMGRLTRILLALLLLCGGILLSLRLAEARENQRWEQETAAAITRQLGGELSLKHSNLEPLEEPRVGESLLLVTVGEGYYQATLERVEGRRVILVLRGLFL